MAGILSVTTGDCEMKYYRFGAEGAPAVVILPGLSLVSVLESAAAVAAAYRCLAEHFDVYLFDRRSNLPQEYTVSQMAEDTAAAIRELGLGQVFLYGVSQGGMMAQLIAARYPHMVRGMVLSSTACCVTEAEERMFGCWLDAAGAGDAQTLMDAFCEAVYSEAFYEANRKAFRRMSVLVTDADLKRFLVLARGLQGFDARPELGSVTCPALVMGGSDDRILHEGALTELADALGCPCRIFNGYGHAVYDEAPGFTDHIRNFFVTCVTE